MVLMMYVRVKQDFSRSFYLSDLGDNLTLWGLAKIIRMHEQQVASLEKFSIWEIQQSGYDSLMK